MHSLSVAPALLCLLAGVVATFHTPQSVFLDKQQANSLMHRQKRNAAGSTMEQVCMENVCTYEQARRFFPDSYQTDLFWAVYVDGDQCADKPCKNGGMCSDSVGGYDCVCKSGFSGVHCEIDETLCTMEPGKGCSQFCKPGYTAYQCSCAQGWTLSNTDRKTCVTAAPYPCGKARTATEWAERQSTNAGNNYAGVACSSTECPWQALLKNSQSSGFCGGVILSVNLVLTTAECAKRYPTFQVVVGTSLPAPQTLSVKKIHYHQSYTDGAPDNDLAVLELNTLISFRPEVSPACLPERDFADKLQEMSSPTIVTGWKESSEASSFQGTPTLNHLTYKTLPDCVRDHPNLITNKMGCTAPSPNADCQMSSGSPLLTMYRDVTFLTGVVSKPAGASCSSGYIVQRVSRYLAWLRSLMSR